MKSARLIESHRQKILTLIHKDDFVLSRKMFINENRCPVKLFALFERRSQRRSQWRNKSSLFRILFF